MKYNIGEIVRIKVDLGKEITYFDGAINEIINENKVKIAIFKKRQTEVIDINSIIYRIPEFINAYEKS